MDAERLQEVAERDQLWASLRPLLPEIGQLASGDFSGSPREQQLVQVLARIVVAELKFRADQAESDAEGAMTESEWLDCSNLRQMLTFVRPRATVHKTLAFASSFDRLIPFPPEHDQGQAAEPPEPAPIAMGDDIAHMWDNNILIDALLREILRRVRLLVRQEESVPPAQRGEWMRALCDLLRDIFAPFQSVTLVPRWLAANDGAGRKLAAFVYEEQAFDQLPILADALEDAGCTEQVLLDHLRGPGPHARGCWPLDLLLTKE